MSAHENLRRLLKAGSVAEAELLPVSTGCDGSVSELTIFFSFKNVMLSFRQIRNSGEHAMSRRTTA